MKKLLLPVSVILTLFLSGSLFTSMQAFASDPIETFGEIAGGKSEAIPIQLKVGEMIQGEVIIRKDPLEFSINDASGNRIHILGRCSSACSFWYSAGYEGQHYLVITNPDGFSVGTRGYTLHANIMQSHSPPGTGSGQNVTASAPANSTQPSSGSSTWIIVVIVIAVIIGIFMFIRRGRSRPIRSSGTDYYEDDDYDDSPRDVYVHSRTVRCPECGGTGTVPSLYIPRSRVKCRNCDGTGRIYD